MNDGQNLFDDATSFSGEWGVDEFLDSTKAKQCIVVAVDNGGSKRMNEYNPYDNERFGKGEGDLYADFLVKILKPFIDGNFRTLKKKENTFISGSSMGGLISLYALLKYPKVFGGAGIFSPAFWVSGTNIYEDIKAKGEKVKAKIYFYGGKLEGETMVPGMLRAFEEMAKISKSKMTIVIRDDGKGFNILPIDGEKHPKDGLGIRLGNFFRISSIRAKADAPMMNVGRWVSPSCISTPQISLMKCSLRPIGTPKILFNCDRPMMMAAALVNPTITGCDRKFTTTPSLNTPSAN